MARKEEENKKVKAARKGMGVYTVRQANTTKGQPNKKDSIVVREKALITHAYADSMNDNYEATGKYCVEDEKATKEYVKSTKGGK